MAKKKDSGLSDSKHPPKYFARLPHW